MKVTNDTYVSIHYTLRGGDGAVIDSSEGGAPLEYIQGQGMIIRGLERALNGREVGEVFEVSVAPKDGYGEYDPSLLSEVPLKAFGGIVPEVGKAFVARTPRGPVQVRVAKVEGDKVTVDPNHELAGKMLNFSVQVVAVRELDEGEAQPSEFGASGGEHCCGRHEGGEHHCCGRHRHEEAEDSSEGAPSQEHHCCGRHEGGEHHCCHDSEG